MIFIFYLFIFLLGLIVGSFLNCAIYRTELQETDGSGKKSPSFLKGRSFCPNCKHTLSWLDLIPIFSFLALRGKCRYCSQKISWQYPLMELATAFLFVFLFWKLGFIQNSEIFNSLNSLLVICYLLIVSCLLLAIFVFDLKHYKIPDSFVFSALAVVFLYRVIGIFVSGSGIFEVFLNPFFSALVAGLFFLAIVLVSKEKWMGWGDVTLAALMGLFLGFPAILAALLLAFCVGGIIGIILVISGKKKLKSEVPFGPFLVFGTFLALFWGQDLINWYINLFTF